MNTGGDLVVVSADLTNESGNKMSNKKRKLELNCHVKNQKNRVKKGNRLSSSTK